MSIPYPSSSTGHEVRTIIAPTRLAVPRPALSRSAPSSPTFPRPAPSRAAPPTPVQRIQTPSSLSIASSSKPPIPPRRNILLGKTVLVNETKTPIPTMDSMVGLAVPKPALPRSTPPSPTFPRPAPSRAAPPTPVQRIQTPSSLSIASSSKPPIPPRRNILLGKTVLVNETKTPIPTMDSMVGLAVPKPALPRSTPPSPTFPRPAPSRAAPPTPVQRIQTPSSLSIASSSKPLPPIPPRRNILPGKTVLVNETKTPIPTMDSMVGHSSVSTLSLQQMDFLSMNNFDTNKSAEIPVVISAVTSQQVSSSIAPDEEVSSEIIKKILLKRRDEFMANAVAAMKAGDEENANIYLNIVMMFNDAIKVAKEVKLDEDVLNDIPKTPSPYRGNLSIFKV
uniref:Uncharacterized protein n=1 Tax=Acrobeloides nanus TaxID=290746 RepID=A0A914DFZ3_9BILA